MYHCKTLGLLFDYFSTFTNFYRNSTTATSAIRKLAVSLADSIDLRVILSVLCIMTEVMREELKNVEQSDYKDNIEAFKEDLGTLLQLPNRN